MERAFIFDNINTWHDWKLILTAKTKTPPEIKTNYVELDGMSGSLDLTEALSGEVKYKDRTISASFWTNEGNRKTREGLLLDIISRLHGRKVKIIEPDNPAHYFFGRCKITDPNNTLPYLSFNLEATCEPWRYALEESIRRLNVYNDSLVKTLIINNNGVKTLTPNIDITGKVKITLNGVSVNLTDGTYQITDLKLKRGVNEVGVSGNGSATFIYREASL